MLNKDKLSLKKRLRKKEGHEMLRDCQEYLQGALDDSTQVE